MQLLVQLSIDLPGTPAGLTALADVLHAVGAVPGAVVIPDGDTWPPELPLPRPSTPDSLGGLRICPRSRTVLRDGRSVDLTRLEFDLLEFLARRPNRVHGRGVLMAEVWGMPEARGSRTVDVHVRRLRDKLGPYATVIATVRGVGYRLDGAHRVVVEPDSTVDVRAV